MWFVKLSISQKCSNQSNGEPISSSFPVANLQDGIRYDIGYLHKIRTVINRFNLRGMTMVGNE